MQANNKRKVTAHGGNAAREITREEFDLILRIADRALLMYREFALPDSKLTVSMDLEFAHQCVPIDLARLLDADNETFAHDVFGIRRHMNRATKQLEGCFLPRTAKRS